MLNIEYFGIYNIFDYRIFKKEGLLGEDTSPNEEVRLENEVRNAYFI